MKILVNEKLSAHRFKDTNGYLICTDAILARTGKQTYRKNEVFADSDDDSEIEVDRRPEEVFSEKTMSSFENCPITVEHPDEDVNPDNYKEYSVGFVRDIHKGEFNGQPVMLGTLVITDADTIEEIERGEHTDLSCGYDCDIFDEECPQQRNIRGNHIALCQQGRAGIAKIVDSVKDYQSIEETTKKIKELPMRARRDLKNAANFEKESLFHAIIAYVENIVNEANPSIKELVKMQGDKIIRDLKAQFLVGDSIMDSSIDRMKESLLNIFKKYNYNRDEAIAEVNSSIAKGRYDIIATLTDWVYDIYKGKNKINDSIKDVEPYKGEEKADFISRFMEETKAEYPDTKQRLAVAYSYWEKRNMKDADFSSSDLTRMRVDKYRNVDIYKVNGMYCTNPNTSRERFYKIDEVKEYIDKLYGKQDSIKDAGEHTEQMAQMQYEKLKRKRAEIEKEIDRNDNNPRFDISQLNKDLDYIDDEIKKLKSQFGYCLKDSKKYEIHYQKDSINYIQIVKANNIKEAIKKLK